MNSERSQAYGRVMKTLTDLGPAKLHADEQELIRDAADTLLFTDDASAEKVLDSVDQLASRLVDSGRLLEETADKLLSDLEDCGPAPAVAP
jgi:predicted dinucleotide-binding enzyme